MDDPLSAETERLRASLPAGRRFAVIGSTSFWNPESAELCETIAAELAGIESLLALTGGMEGVGRAFGDAFAAARKRLGFSENLIHLLPSEMRASWGGKALSAGEDFYERRELLGRVAEIYLVIEGGPGTAHEADVAAQYGGILIPVGRSGGHAEALFPQCSCPSRVSPDDWALLNDPGPPAEVIGRTVGRIVQSVLN